MSEKDKEYGYEIYYHSPCFLFRPVSKYTHAQACSKILRLKTFLYNIDFHYLCY